MVLKNLKKVLIIDDEETLTWSMSKSLSKDRDKYEVMIANNGKEALNLLKRSDVDLVISDIRMPDINGLDVTAQVTQEYPSIKVVLLSMYDNEEYVLRALDIGAAGYLLKDAGAAELELAVRDNASNTVRTAVETLRVPDLEQSLSLSSVVLADAIVKLDPPPKAGEKEQGKENEKSYLYPLCPGHPQRGHD